jgi:lipopolysaccharide export system protein LptA
MGLDIQQTAEGFSISKSEQGRTQFKVSASKAVQFKEGGRAELHDVKIVVYGKDASRFDQIAGDDFEYDPGSGNVTAKGRVLIDLEVESRGRAARGPVASPKKPEPHFTLKPTASSSTRIRATLRPRARSYFKRRRHLVRLWAFNTMAKTGTMNLLSAVAMTVNRPQPVHLNADHGVITKQPHQVVLNTVHMTREQQEARSDQATFFLRDDNTVDRVLAEGDVETEIPAGPR